MDGRIDVLQLMGGDGVLGPEAKAEATQPTTSVEALSPPGSGGMASQDRPSPTTEAPHTAPDGEPLVPGKNCYQVIGTFVPGPDGMRLMVTVDGSSLSPKQVLDHLKGMAASIVQQLQQTAKRIQVATELPPHTTPGGKRGKH